MIDLDFLQSNGFKESGAGPGGSSAWHLETEDYAIVISLVPGDSLIYVENKKTGEQITYVNLGGKLEKGRLNWFLLLLKIPVKFNY